MTNTTKTDELKCCSINKIYYLTEDDFNQSFDNRVLKSYVEDIRGGDNFADYCSYIFKLYEEEGYYD
jgi:hypothetical protein